VLAGLGFQAWLDHPLIETVLNNNRRFVDAVAARLETQETLAGAEVMDIIVATV
jgi:hypothetical protein